jgi:hypothetical protein
VKLSQIVRCGMVIKNLLGLKLVEMLIIILKPHGTSTFEFITFENNIFSDLGVSNNTFHLPQINLRSIECSTHSDT